MVIEFLSHLCCDECTNDPHTKYGRSIYTYLLAGAHPDALMSGLHSLDDLPHPRNVFPGAVTVVDGDGKAVVLHLKWGSNPWRQKC